MADTITTTSSQAPEWLQPYLKSHMDRAFSVADTPYQQYQGQRVADLNGTQQTAMDAIQNRAMNGNPVMNAAQGALQGIAGGQGLGAQAASNPYLTQQNANANAFNPYANVQNTAAGAANPYLNATNANANTFNPYANVSNAAAGASNPYLNATNASANTFNPYANATNAAAGAQNQNINAYNSQAGAANPYLNVQNPLAQAEKRLLGRAFGNGQDQVIEQAGGTSYQVFVPPGDGVERTRVNGNAVIEWLQVQSLASRGSVSCCSNW